MRVDHVAVVHIVLGEHLRLRLDHEAVVLEALGLRVDLGELLQPPHDLLTRRLVAALLVLSMYICVRQRFSLALLVGDLGLRRGQLALQGLDELVRRVVGVAQPH